MPDEGKPERRFQSVMPRRTFFGARYYVDQEDYMLLARENEELRAMLTVQRDSATEAYLRCVSLLADRDALRAQVEELRDRAESAEAHVQKEQEASARYGTAAREERDRRIASERQLAHALAVWREQMTEQGGWWGPSMQWVERMEAALTGAGEERD